MNLLDLAIAVVIDDKATPEVEALSSSLKGKLAGAGAAAAKGVAAIVGAGTAATGALSALETATRDYRAEQGRLDTAFEAAGYSTENAQKAYQDFYRILGESDTAVEASQLLAKLADDEQDLTTWTDIAAGVWGTFGQSLPIEGLIEAANETAKVGTVTGTLADALNWAGISEDEFNAKLAECGTEAERNDLIMDTLAGTYDEASQAFKDNNQELINQRDRQMELEEMAGRLGEAVGKLKDLFWNEFGPAIKDGADKLTEFINGIDQETIDNAKTAVEDFGKKFQDALPWIAGVTGGLIGFKGALAISTLIQTVTTAMKAFKAANEGATISQILLNAAMNANPFVLIVTLIATIVTALITLYMTNDDFRNRVNEAWWTIKTKAEEVWGRIVEFFTVIVPEAIETLKTFFAELPEIIRWHLEQVINKVKKWADSMKQEAKEAIEKFKEGIEEKWEGVKTWFSELPQKIKDAIGDLGDTLKQAGKDVIEGFWSGLKEKWESVKSWFGEKTASIPNLKGPKKVDLKLLVENGEAIMQGLKNGLTKGWGGIKSTLGNMTADISPTFGTVEPKGSKSSGPSVVNQYFYDKVQSAAEFARAQRKMNTYGLAGTR